MGSSKAIENKGFLISLFFVVLISGAWCSMSSSVPFFTKISGLVAFEALIIGLFVYAPEWLVAIFTLGQPFLNMGFAFLGGASRDTPISPPLLILAFLAAIVVFMNANKRINSITYSSADISKPRWVQRGIIITTIIIVIIMFLGAVYSSAPKNGIQKAMGYVMFDVVPFMLIVLYVKGEDSIKRLLIAFICLGLALTILTLIDMFLIYGGIPSWGLRYGKHNFLGLQLEGSMWFGRRVGITLLSIMTLSFISKNPIWKSMALLLIPFLLGIVLLSSRGPFFALIPAFLIIIILSNRSKINKLSLLVLTVVLPIVVLTGMIRLGNAPLASSTINRYSSFEEQRYYRLSYWNSAWHTFLSHPITGVGTSGWVVSGYKEEGGDPDPGYVHNIFLELAAELGILGLLPFLIFLYCSINSIIRSILRASPGSNHYILSIWAISILVMAIINACISGDIPRNDHIWIAAGIIYQLSSLSGMAKSVIYE